MSEPHERLNEAMNARRLTLRMNWRALAEAAGISSEALRAIRRGDYKPAELTAVQLDEALGWTPGSTTRILAGEEPSPADQSIPAPPAAAEAKAPAEEEGEVGELDLESYVPQTPAERALLAIYRADQQLIQQQLAELNRKVDRLTVVRNEDETGSENVADERERRRKGA